MPYGNRLKKEVKALRVQNSELRIKVRDLTALFIKGDLIPRIAITECLCKGSTPSCARCIARDILTEAGFTLKAEKPKSQIALPDKKIVIAKG